MTLFVEWDAKMNRRATKEEEEEEEERSYILLGLLRLAKDQPE